MKKSIGLLAFFLLPALLTAQSPRSAVGGQGKLWAGGEFSIYNPDFGCSTNIVFTCWHDTLYGPTAFFDLGFTNKLSLEGDARWLVFHGVGGQKESSYTVGPRYRLWHREPWSLHGKLNLGGMWLQTPGYPQAGTLKGSYFAVAPGADLDYRVSDRLMVRAEYDYEFLPSFTGPPTFSSTGQVVTHGSGLTPNGFSIGVAWRLLGY